ncbi:group 1 glycosyl transferase [Caballeronia pedi]|uniref:Group 1 glycosyl transferase n=1 Tax=Caballeronia pedi TaxID=1777141 RepID=A0A157ZZQ6_9BURK|nr:glycosyltransferase family 4 protein [Caballeronia pedi]SAK50367.1 group 1 glycosyl transferase [Caballeronia pedi]
MNRVRFSMKGNVSKRCAVQVLHVGPNKSAKGGIASVLNGYAENRSLFEAQNYDVHFSATCGHQGAVGIFQYLSAWWRVVRESATRQTDIVHIHTSIKGSLLRKWLLAATCIGLRQRYVVHIHSGAIAHFVDDLPGPARIAVSWMLRHASQVICLSREVHAWLMRRHMCESGKFQLIYNGIADMSSVEATRPPLSGPPVMLFLGRLSEAKGLAVLLEAAEALRNQGHSFRLLLGGDGDVRTLTTDIDRRGLSGVAEYLGWVSGDSKAHLLATADIFLLPSRSEGFPVSIVEAMASGIAIVSTTIPGVVDAITHEQEGLLVPPDDADALTDAIRTLICEPALRGRLGAAARQRFLDQFTIQRTVEKLARTYQQVMDDSFPK